MYTPAIHHVYHSQELKVLSKTKHRDYRVNRPLLATLIIGLAVLGLRGVLRFENNSQTLRPKAANTAVYSPVRTCEGMMAKDLDARAW